MSEVNFWNDKDKANLTIKKINDLKEVVEPIISLDKSINGNLELLKEITDDDVDFKMVLESTYEDDFAMFENLELQTYLSGEYDSNNCLLEIHSGAGGTESCDWANMLYRMYSRY